MTNPLQILTSNGRRRTVESASGTVDMFSSMHHDLIGMELNTDLLSAPFVRDPSMQIPYGGHIPGGPHAVEQWYTNSNDDPWHPKDIALPGNQNGMNITDHGFTFAGGYRDGISPSECDTLPIASDSGYASHGAKQSIATASICYDEPLENVQKPRPAILPE